MTKRSLWRPRSGRILFTLLLLAAHPAPTRALDRETEANQLQAQAEEHLGRRTIEGRRAAIAELERATELRPQRADLQLSLARAYWQAGFLKQARRRYERAVSLAPNQAEARMGLGNAWRRDWLKYLERRSLDLACEHYSACGRIEPARVDAWLLLSALEVERGDLKAAREAADRALGADRTRAEALLAGGSIRWRQGEIAPADSLFRLAIGRLRKSVRDRLEDIAPLASERDTMVARRLSAAERAEFVRRFWREHDPDLASAENEAQLEYWARVAQAFFLFYDPARREWDQRGEVYVRYGPPKEAQYNPIGTSLYGYRSGSNVAFPLNVLVWSYPELGMSVVMNDRMLSERYEMPLSMTRDMDPLPDPDSLRARDVVATHGLRGVFPTLPPRAEKLEVRSQIALFEGESGGARLFAGVSAPGAPSDTPAAEFVLLDSSYTEVARFRRALGPSACEPAELRAADFDTPIAPGEYMVGLSVRNGARRGAARERVTLAPPDGSLTMSDLVVTCGLPASPPATVRLDPNPSGRVAAGDPLVAYFEVYHLARGDDGLGRFEYETTVRSATRDRRMWIQRWLSPRREGAELGVTRQDRVLGTVRRQFVSIPVQDLPPGRYRLDVTVRDVLTGDERRRSAEFTRDPAAR
jgi:GWxTD domain-containing protein